MPFQSVLPTVSLSNGDVEDGIFVALPSYCRKKLAQSNSCKDFYSSLVSKREGFYQCPFGFTCRTFTVIGEPWAVTGVIAHPRFGSGAEGARAKEAPNNRVGRDAIEKTVLAIRQIEERRADAVQDAAQVLPQAFHELRKLNAAVLQHSEREIQDRGDSRALLSIRSAAELMRNSFEILEALANPAILRTLPNDSTINLFDLLFKMKRVYGEKASQKEINIIVDGPRAIIAGSQKTFPIVPAVLLENAIKYGLRGSRIRVEIQATRGRAILTIENATTHHIDPVGCFKRGARYAPEIEGGGFGLFLAKEVVDCHEGSLHCEVAQGLVRMVADFPLRTVIEQK